MNGFRALDFLAFHQRAAGSGIYFSAYSYKLLEAARSKPASIRLVKLVIDRCVGAGFQLELVRVDPSLAADLRVLADFEGGYRDVPLLIEAMAEHDIVFEASN